MDDHGERIELLSRDDLKIDPRSENFTYQISELQRILQFGAVPLKMNEDSTQRYFSEAQVRGYLSIHGDPSKSHESSTSNRYYCELVDTFLFYKRGETDVKYKGGMSISFCHVEAATERSSGQIHDGVGTTLASSGSAPASVASSVHSADSGAAANAAAKSALANFEGTDIVTDMTTVEQERFIHSTESLGAPRTAASTDGEDNYEDLYMAFLERQEGSHCFKVYTAEQIFILQAESAEDRERWVNAIQKSLKKEFTEQVWQAKQQSARELQPLYREQFVFSLDKHKFVLNSLHSTGLLADVSVLRSKNKEKSGVLAIETKDHFDASVWTDYFLVLLEGVLYYFAHSSASIPKGFVALKYAHVSLEGPMLSDDEFVFRITTPLRSLCLRAKHAVALAEWIAVLERAIANCRRQVKSPVVSSVSGQDLSSILTRINQHRAKLGSFSSLIESPKACRIFEEFLDATHESSLLKFWVELDKYKKHCTGIRNEQRRYRSETDENHQSNSSLHERKASKVYRQTVDVLDAYSAQASPPASPRNGAGSSKASQRSSSPEFDDIDSASAPLGSRSAPSTPQNSKDIHRPIAKRSNGHHDTNFGDVLFDYNGVAGTPPNEHLRDDDDEDDEVDLLLGVGTGTDDRTGSTRGSSASPLAPPTGEARNDIVLTKMFERLTELAHSIFQKFLDESSPTALQRVATIKLSQKAIDQTRGDLELPAAEMFHDIQIAVGPVLRKRYDAFLQDDLSKKLVEGVNRGSRGRSERDVAPFGPDMTYRFVALCTNGTPHKRFVKTYKFPYDRRMMSLGRDISNDIVLNDNRVSRSHARVTYSATECVYYDLGSSHGTKLNRKRFVHGKLADGDLLQIGDTVLRFEVREKKKKNFFNKLRKK